MRMLIDAVGKQSSLIILQAVEYAQTDGGNPFVNFTRALKSDQQRLDRLESNITQVLVRLSTVELIRPKGLRAPVFMSGEVDRLMRTAHRLHELGEGISTDDRPTDVAIEIAQEEDGSLVVFPAVPA